MNRLSEILDLLAQGFVKIHKVFLNGLDQGAADNYAVGKLDNPLNLLDGRYSKSNGNG